MNSAIRHTIESLSNSMAGLADCLNQNERLLSGLEQFLQEAEEFSNRTRRSSASVMPFGQYRAGRIPIPENNHSAQHSAFSDRYLGPLKQKTDWSEKERSVLLSVIRMEVGEEAEASSIQWTEIARKCVEMHSRFERNASSCQIEYCTQSKRPGWSREEDEKLSSLVTENGGTNWTCISETLQRPAAECFSRCYSTLHHPLLVPVEFTLADDARLSEIVGRVGEGAWSQVSAELGSGHTDIQCMNRWTKTLKPGIQGGRWNPVLDSLLLAAVAVYGEGNWVQIAKHVPGKTDRKCRERFADKFTEGLKPATEWTNSEDEKLIKAVEKHGVGKWSKVKDELTGRTDSMCRLRYKRLGSLTSK